MLQPQQLMQIQPIHGNSVQPCTFCPVAATFPQTWRIIIVHQSQQSPCANVEPYVNKLTSLCDTNVLHFTAKNTAKDRTVELLMFCKKGRVNLHHNILCTGKSLITSITHFKILLLWSQNFLTETAKVSTLVQSSKHLHQVLSKIKCKIFFVYLNDYSTMLEYIIHTDTGHSYLSCLLAPVFCQFQLQMLVSSAEVVFQ